jgi:carbon-monoxide dehydrogenase medium subunit
MKSSNFSYSRPSTLAEVFDIFDHYGDDAVILAGGQSLVPSLNMRLSNPSVLIDINRIAELRGLTEEDGYIKIGALTRHHEVENSILVGKHIPLLHMAMPHVAHTAIRSRGTFGGSLAFADAAAEIPAITLTCEAIIQVQSQQGRRQIAAIDFFQGLYSTDLQKGEVITSVLFPKSNLTHHVFKEFTRRQGDYATVGIAMTANFESNAASKLRIVYFGMSDRPVVDIQLAQDILAQGLNTQTILQLSSEVGNDIDITSDIHHDRQTKHHLLKVIVRRALLELLGKVENGPS